MFAISKMWGIALIIPSLLLCMDETSRTLTQSVGSSGSGNSYFSVVIHPLQDPLLQVRINDIHEKTASSIPKINEHDNQSVSNFISLIGNINTFMRENPHITEHYLGSFSYVKESSLGNSVKEKIFDIASPLHVALFFKQLQNYNDKLKAYEKTHPSLADWTAHLHNKGLQIDKAMKIGEAIGICITTESIKHNAPPLQTIEPTVAITAFAELITNTVALIKLKNNPHLKTLADLIYLNIYATTETQEKS